MTTDTPDLRPLERLLASRDYALYHARRNYRKDLMYSRATLSFRPDMMKRVAAEAPILTDIPRLKRWQIYVPETWHATYFEVTLTLDFTWISESWIFHEFPMYVQCTLDRLLDDNPFFVAPSIVMFPRLIDVGPS